MEISYQECYQKFLQAYGPFNNWPLPHAYLNWFLSLSEQYQMYYLHPSNYCHLYDWARLQTGPKKQAPKKPSRAQKRKLKKKALQQEYNKQKALIGRWVQKERKDLINGLQKIEQQEKKAKQKKQKKLSYLIEIHKEVYKHHIKRKGTADPINRRVETKNKKKRMSVIKKIKQIFQSRRQKSLQQLKEKGQQKLEENKESNTIKKVQESNEEQYVDVSDDEGEKDINKKDSQKGQMKIPTVSFPIRQIEYKNIGKLAGKTYNEIGLRQWVTNVPNQQLEEIALRLVNRLAYKQAIKKVNNPQKAKKLIVSGLKECKRTLTTILQNKKSKCLIVALNIERNNLVKGVDDQIQKCITLGQDNKIPVIHVSTRAKLGRAFTGKFGPRLSIISIINWEGYQDYVDDLMAKWHKSCEQYKNLP